MPKTDPLSKPTTYCDSLCERCPLAWGCDKSIETYCFDLSQRPQPAITVRDDVLRAPPKRLPSGRTPPRKRVLTPKAGARLRQAANALYGAVDKAIGHMLTDESWSLADEIYNRTVTLVATCWRIAEACEHGVDASRWRALEPVLLLAESLDERLEGLLGRLEQMIDSIPWLNMHDMQLELREDLVPMVQVVSKRARRNLAAMVSRGEAPSPFCKVWPDWYQRLDAENGGVTLPNESVKDAS
jgi:hypothetical protein